MNLFSMNNREIDKDVDVKERRVLSFNCDNKPPFAATLDDR